MGSHDPADRVSTFTPSVSPIPPQVPREVVIGSTDARSASFDVGGFTLELVATAGAATLAVAVGADRRTYRVDSASLDRWADATARLLGLSAALGSSGTADYRAPFLMDGDGRASLAFESAVTPGGVAHRILLMRNDGRVASVATSADVLRELVEAARGAAQFARSGSPAG